MLLLHHVRLRVDQPLRGHEDRLLLLGRQGLDVSRGRLGQRQFPYWAMRALAVDAMLLRQLSSGDWSGFTRALQGDRSAPTPVDLLDTVVQPVLHAV